MASRRPYCSQARTSRIVPPERAAASRVPVRTCSPAAWKNGSRRLPPMVPMKCPARRAAASTLFGRVGVADRRAAGPTTSLLGVGDGLRVERPHRPRPAAQAGGERPQVGLVGGGDREPGCGEHGGDGEGAGLVRPRPHHDQGDVLPGHPHLPPPTDSSRIPLLGGARGGEWPGAAGPRATARRPARSPSSPARSSDRRGSPVAAPGDARPARRPLRRARATSSVASTSDERRPRRVGGRGRRRSAE